MGNGSKSITCGLLKYTILLHHLLHLDILCSDGCNLFEQELSWIFLDYNLFEALFVKLKNGENLYYIIPGCHNLRLVLISKFSQNFVLETRMLCFSRHSRQKCRKSRFWSKTAVFSLSATKVHFLLIFCLPHLYNLLQPEDLRTEDRGLRTED